MVKQETMPKPETREAASRIACEQAEGNRVYRSDGTKIGEIERLMIDRTAAEVTAGLLIYRTFGGTEILLTHPGGPFWSRKDQGCWSIPTWSVQKGIAEPGDLLSRARREFADASIGGGFISLDPVEQKSGKVLQAFAVEADLDLKSFRANDFSLEWPPCSGRRQTFPEIDRIGYFAPRTALRKILPSQWPLLLELSEKLGWRMTQATIPGSGQGTGPRSGTPRES